MDSKRKAVTYPLVGAVVALQFAEFGHMVHPCAPGAERAQCEALPGLHTPEAPAQGDVKLFGPEITATSSISANILATRII